MDKPTKKELVKILRESSFIREYVELLLENKALKKVVQEQREYMIKHFEDNQ